MCGQWSRTQSLGTGEYGRAPVRPTRGSGRRPCHIASRPARAGRRWIHLASAFARAASLLRQRRAGWSLPLLLAAVCGLLPLSATGSAPRPVAAPTQGGPVVPVALLVGGGPLGALGAIDDGVPLAAADALVPALGGSILGAGSGGVTRIVLGGHVLVAAPGEDWVTVDGRGLPLAFPAPLLQGRLYLPAALLAEAAGAVAVWPGPGGAIVVTPAQVARPHLAPPGAAADQAVQAPPQPPAVIPYGAADLNLMARVVQGEAADQPMAAKIGVAAVIVNRVRSPSWPDTIPGVIYAPGQFQAVGGPLFQSPPSAAAVQAALEALHGVDPTHGATYFYNPAQTWLGSWIYTRTTVITVGAFRFAR